MKKREVFWGLLFIFAAVLIILNQLGYFTAGIGMFDILATVVLVGVMITSIWHINFWGILFPLAGLCIIYAEEWHITEFTPWPALLTALLCSIGFSMIFQRPHGWHYHTSCDSSFGSNVVNVKDDKEINCSVSFGDSIKYVNSDDFVRANIKCSFGDVKVYFDNAQIPSGKADIYLDVSFGDAVLYIPKTWKVVNDLHVFLGDAGEKNRSLDATSPVVTIHGNVSFGDAKIIYV